MRPLSVLNQYTQKGSYVILHIKGKYEGYLLVNKRNYNKLQGFNWFITRSGNTPDLYASVAKDLKCHIHEVMKYTSTVYYNENTNTYIFDYTNRKCNFDFTDYKLVRQPREADLMKSLEKLLA